MLRAILDLSSTCLFERALPGQEVRRQIVPNPNARSIGSLVGIYYHNQNIFLIGLDAISGWPAFRGEGRFDPLRRHRQLKQADARGIMDGVGDHGSRQDDRGFTTPLRR